MMLTQNVAQFVGKHIMLFISTFIVAPVLFLLIGCFAGQICTPNERAMLLTAYAISVLLGFLIDILSDEESENNGSN